MIAVRAKRFLRDDSGVVAIIVAMLLVVFVGFSALVIDMGYWYNVRRQLQTAADAAALAGCQELILDKTDAAIWDTVEEYAALNAVGPADGVITVIPVSAGGLSDIGSNFVKVTVEQEATAFFGRLFGVMSKPIQAQSRAVIAVANEGKNLIPFSVPILILGDDPEIIARVGGYWEELTLDSYYGGDPVYSEEVLYSAGPASDECISLPVDVDIYNRYGILAEEIENLQRALIRGVDFPITGVEFDKNWVQPGTEVKLRVSTFYTAEKPTGTITGPGMNTKLEFFLVDPGGPDDPAEWEATVTVPDTTERYAMYEAKISVEYNGTKYEIEGKAPAAILVARRANAPVERVEFYPAMHEDTDSLVYSNVVVHLTRLEMSTKDEQFEYELKLNEGEAAEAGSFGMLDFNNIVPADSYPPIVPETGYAEGQHWKDQIENGFLQSLWINDLVGPWTGNAAAIVGPNGPLTKRIEASQYLSDSFLTWLLFDDCQEDSRVVRVPIVEMYTPISGSTGWFRIESFQHFYIESSVEDLKTSSSIRGYFIPYYVAPSQSATEDPGTSGMYILTPRLVSEDVDF